jgi:hypothetical protein
VLQVCTILRRLMGRELWCAQSKLGRFRTPTDLCHLEPADEVGTPFDLEDEKRHNANHVCAPRAEPLKSRVIEIQSSSPNTSMDSQLHPSLPFWNSPLTSGLFLLLKVSSPPELSFPLVARLKPSFVRPKDRQNRENRRNR